MPLGLGDSIELHAEEFLRAIKKGDVLIACPPYPGTDPDAVAAALLVELLVEEIAKSQFPFMRRRVTLYCPTPIFSTDNPLSGFLPVSSNPLYSFLPIKRFTIKFPEQPPACVLMTDYGDFKRGGVELDQLPPDCKIIGIDHHQRPANDFPASGLQIIGEAASTTIVLYRFLKSFLHPRPEIWQKIALYTLVGIVADTNGLRDLSVGADTLQVVAECTAEDIPWQQILACQPHETETLDVLAAFRANFEEKLRFFPLIATQEKIMEWGGEQVVEDALRIMENTKDSVVALIKEQPNGSWQVSMRSRNYGEAYPPISVGEIADKFGGGGHLNKAGVTFRKSTDPNETKEEYAAKILKRLRIEVIIRRRKQTRWEI